MLEKKDIDKARSEGYDAFGGGNSLSHANPYYPGSSRHEAFIEGWTVAEFDKTFKEDCPWRQRVVCAVTRGVCMKDSCGLWYLKGKVEEK